MVTLTRKDFRSAVPRPKPLRELRQKFKLLEASIIQELPSKFNPMKRTRCHYVSRPNRRGGGYWSGMWLGFASPKFDDPRKGLMFQFGLWNKRVFALGIWLQGKGKAPRARKMAWFAINSQPNQFVSIVRGLGRQYCIDIWREGDRNSLFFKTTDQFTSNDIDPLLDALAGRDSFMKISKQVPNRQVISWRNRIATEIARTFSKLHPLYSFFLKGDTATRRKFRLPSPEGILRSSREAEELVEKLEKNQGRIVKVVSDQPVGYDIESKQPKTGRVRRIEVKSRKLGGTLQLTPNEYRAAAKYGNEYFVYVVRSPERVEYIRDPIRSCRAVRKNQPVWELTDWTERTRKLPT